MGRKLKWQNNAWVVSRVSRDIGSFSIVRQSSKRFYIIRPPGFMPPFGRIYKGSLAEAKSWCQRECDRIMAERAKGKK